MQGQRILLLWIGRLGDLLSATAFIRAMRQKFPDAKITLLTRGYVRDLAEILSGIDERIYLPSPGALRGAGGFFSHFLLKKFDLCVDLNTSYSRTSGALVILSKAQKRVSFDKKGARFFYTDTIAAASRDEHMLSCYGRLAQFFSAPYTPEMKIEIPDGDISRAQKILSSLNLKPDALKIAVHPGNFKKFDHRWPKGKFIELSKKILSLPDVELIYIAGPGEEKPVKTMLGFLPAHVKYIPPTSAPTLAAILKNMDLFIVSATGTMHLAAAVKTAMLSFHSGYTYNCWRPLTENNVSLCGKTWNSCRDISVGDAWQAVAKFPALKK